MIQLEKGSPPAYLMERAAGWTAELLAAIQTRDEATRSRVEKYYNRPQIKDALLAETRGKCAYCESRIRATGYPRVEHLQPRAVAPDRTFDWDNLTIACEGCNGRKGNYWDTSLPLLNPYEDDPERYLWVPDGWIRPWAGAPRGQLAIDRLDLNRANLIERRTERLRLLQALIDRWRNANVEVERQVFRYALDRELEPDKEYLLMVRGLVHGHASDPAKPTA